MRLKLSGALFALLIALTACGGEPQADAPSRSKSAEPSASPSQELPLLKELPIDLSTVDWKKVVAHRSLFDGGLPISDFGHLDGAGTANERRNPQPTFFAPLGTVVVAPVDGVVVEVGTLYSGDSTIMFGVATGHTDVAWETEHVIEVLVHVGDKVTAGQPVAKVSDYLCTYSKAKFGNDAYCGTGIGLTELGYLVGGNPPKHFCPFGELTDPTALPKIETQLAAARQQIEKLAGKRLFDTRKWATPNCIVVDPVEG